MSVLYSQLFPTGSVLYVTNGPQKVFQGLCFKDLVHRLGVQAGFEVLIFTSGSNL